MLLIALNISQPFPVNSEALLNTLSLSFLFRPQSEQTRTKAPGFHTGVAHQTTQPAQISTIISITTLQQVIDF